MFNKKEKNQNLVQKIIEEFKNNHMKIVIAEYGTDGVFSQYFKNIKDFNTVASSLQNITSPKDLA